MTRTKLENWICDIEALPFLTRESLERLQLERLNGLLRRENARGGFYRGLPERLSSLDGLQTLPFTTADDLARFAPGMVLSSQSEISRVISGATSGTTGPSKRVFYSERDLENTVGFFAAGISEMTSAGGTVMVAMPFSGPDGLGELIVRAVESLGARALRAGFGGSCGSLAALVRAGRPDAYIGMPVPLLGLARYMGADCPIERALISGDACPEGVTEMLGRTLGPVFPHYGLRETCLGGAVTCSAHDGMHLRENHIIAEIVGPEGGRLPDGETGELVVTTVGMEAMPLIRYRTGDFTRFLPMPCPCGGVTRRIGAVLRREKNAPSMPELDRALFKVPELIDYRASIRAERLKIEALTADGSGLAGLTAAAEAVWPRPDVAVRRCEPGDVPLYAGKRYIITSDTE